MSTDGEILPGSLALLDAFDEAFAQAVARGMKMVDAYRDVYPNAEDGVGEDNSSVRSRAHRKAKRREVADRIEFLKAERDAAVTAELPERWDSYALGEVAREATEALTAALRACESDPNVPESARSSVRREAVRHAGRVHRAGASRPDVVLGDRGLTSSMLAEAIERMPLCICTLEDLEELENPA